MSKLRVSQLPTFIPLHSVEPPSNARWQNLTKGANAAYERGEKDLAQEGYIAALTEAEHLLKRAERDAKPSQAATILVISHHNLAELATCNGQSDVATSHFQAPFDRLLDLARRSSAPSHLRQSCIANLKEATVGLTTHLQTKGAPITLIAETIKRARCVVKSSSAQIRPTATQKSRLS